MKWLCGLVLLLCGCASGPELPELPAREDLKLDVTVERVYGDLLANPLDPKANGKLAVLLHRMGQYPEAELLYKRANLLAPATFEWIYYMARVQALQGDNTTAMATMRQALSVNPKYLPAWLAAGEIGLRGGDLVGSAAAFRKLEGPGPAGALSAYWLGRVASPRGDTAELVRLYSLACELYPQFGAAHYALGLLYEEMSRQEEATEHLHLAQKYLLDEPRLDDPLLRDVYGEGYRPLDFVRQGHKLVTDERAGEAILAFRKALELDPTCVEAHTGLIKTYGRLHRNADAEQHFRQALSLDQNYDRTYLQYGAVLLEQNRFQEAAIQFAKALEINPSCAEALAYTGYLKEQDGDFDDAVRYYNEALKNKPDYPQAHLRLGAVLIHERREADAAREFALALRESDARTPRMLYQIALVYARTGNSATAEQYRQKAQAAATEYKQSGVAWETEGERWPLG